MLQYENGRFSALGVSFAIPDGFFLDTEAEECLEYGFGARTPDGRYYVVWEIEEGCKGTENELCELFLPGMNRQALSEIQPVTLNGLSGHRVAYEDPRGQFLELRLSVRDGTEIMLQVKVNDRDMPAAMEAPAIKAAMEGIRPE